MSTRYSSDHKSLVMRLLWIYGGNVALLSHLTGIPERTLRHWRAQATMPFFVADSRQQDPSERQVSAVPLPEKNSSMATANELETLRQRLTQQALNLAASLSDDMDEAPLSQRAMALTRLIDRILKLESHAPFDDPYDVVIAFDKPSYERDDNNGWDIDSDSPLPESPAETIDEP
jgi:hypothetical protein